MEQSLKYTYLSKEEYFELEENALEKYEYYDGEIWAMSGGSFRHSRLCSNINYELNGKARNRKDYVSLESNLKISIQKYSHYVYPDASVLCGKPIFEENRTDIILNPLLIVEVLSPSTENYDRTKKFDKYRSLPSFKEYVLIAQDLMRVEVFFRQDESHWFYTVYTQASDLVMLRSLDCDILLADIYDKVELEEKLEDETPNVKS